MPESEKSFKGKLLLDSGQLHGSFFHRSVVLICQHDGEGAFGLVLNQGTKNKVGEVLVADLPDALKEQSIYVGGPVQQGALTYLHTDVFVPHANVMPKLNMGHALDELVDLAESYSPTQQVRIFAGYAGWSSGQLEGELKRKAWVVHPATLDIVFDTDTPNLWKKILL